MSGAKDGGPAFPHTADTHEGWQMREAGMSLRDYLAAKAMHAQASISGLEGEDVEHYARCSYEWADAMLKARGES